MIGRTTERAAVGGRRWPLPPRSAASSERDAGMVLLETALSIPLLAFVAVGLAWALTVASASLSLGDAARSAARGIARGESVDDAVARATASVPGATAQLETSGDEAVVVITDVVRAPIPLLAGIPVTITQRVAIPKEWM